MKIGELIHQKLREDGRTVTWFADRICCTRTHVYKIFDKTSIDTDLLLRISQVLEYNFFEYFSEQLEDKKSQEDVSD